jgi:hypothetical protein
MRLHSCEARPSVTQTLQLRLLARLDLRDVAEDLDGSRCNGELTKFGEGNVRADWAAGEESQLVTHVGQLTASAPNSYCEIWIVNREKIAGFGYLFDALRFGVMGADIFSETGNHSSSSLEPRASRPPTMHSIHLV